MLVQTSLANRTSPVLRGKWVMEVLMGTPPPPPPPDVPDLEASRRSEGRPPADDARADGDPPRQNPTCTSCHRFMDPIGLALDNFDVTASGGSARTACRSTPPATSTTARRSRRRELNAALLKRPMPLVRNFTENLMAYALGRRVEYYDQPAIRAIAKRPKRQLQDVVVHPGRREERRVPDAAVGKPDDTSTTGDGRTKAG